MRKVVILQHRLLHYRASLFDRLRERCLENDIQLHLVHGQATRRESKKRDVGSLAWADVVNNRYIEAAHRDILWQPFPPWHRDAELVVMMQENRLVSNYPWLFGMRGKKNRLAYWGHGRNFQSDAPGGLRERWKKMLVGRVDWWFAYTNITRDILVNDGYPIDRITVLDNAIDNERFQEDLNSVTSEQLSVLRRELNISEKGHVGLFCGSLYPDKRLGFMIDAADRIQSTLPGFQLVIIGDGPSAEEIKVACMSRPWMKWVGVCRGSEKAAYFRLASVVLNPGLVGLHILDSFCAGVPMVTTSDARHSPEIVYLQDKENGLIVSGNAQDYGDAVVNLLSDRTRFTTIQHAAKQASERYTLDNMVSNFVNGIERCLDMPKKV